MRQILHRLLASLLASRLDGLRKKTLDANRMLLGELLERLKDASIGLRHDHLLAAIGDHLAEHGLGAHADFDKRLDAA